MAISLIGQAGVSGNNVSAPGPAVSYTSTGGNSLIVTGLVFTGATSIAGITGVSDSAGNTWHFSASNSQNPPAQANSSGGNFYCVFVAWTLNAAAVTSVSIADGTGNSDFWRIAVSEWSGIVQADAGAAGTGTSASPAAPVAASAAGELIAGAADTATGNLTTQPAGWTSFTSSGGAYCAYDVPVTGAQTAQWTMGGSADWAAAVMTFSPTPLTPPAAPGPLPGPRLARPPAVIVSNAGWRGAGHSR